MVMIVNLGLEVRSFLWGIFRPLEGNLAIPALPFHDVIFPACGQSSDVEMKLIKMKFPEVKMEPFDGPDVLPGFYKHAAGDTARDIMLSNSSNSVDASIKGHQTSILFYFLSAKKFLLLLDLGFHLWNQWCFYYIRCSLIMKY